MTTRSDSDKVAITVGEWWGPAYCNVCTREIDHHNTRHILARNAEIEMLVCRDCLAHADQIDERLASTLPPCLRRSRKGSRRCMRRSNSWKT